MSKITIKTILEKKKKKEKITALTAYDYSFATLLDEAGVDIVLVGDSLGMVVLGYSTTLPVSMEDMIRHTRAVSKGVSTSLIVADMPFLSFQTGEEKGVENAGRLLQNGAEAVKLEGGSSVEPLVRKLVNFGIPVMGHLGLTPQAIHAFGGYKIQGKSEEAAKLLLKEAKLLESAGCFSIVLECVPKNLAEEITESLQIPTIGIGAGEKCDGQILVLYDCLGLTPDFNPKFAKKFADLRELSLKGVRQYIQEVKSGEFPDDAHSF